MGSYGNCSSYDGHANPDDWNNHPNKKNKSAKESDSVKFDEVQLQKKYNSHAKDFGVKGNYSNTNRQAFESALKSHIDDSNTIAIKGTYRGNIDVTHYFNPQNNLNVMVKSDGSFLSGWRLNNSQIQNLFKVMNIQ